MTEEWPVHIVVLQFARDPDTDDPINWDWTTLLDMPVDVTFVTGGVLGTAPKPERTERIDYITPKEATKIRVHYDGSYNWLIDAANDRDEHTEACWDSRIVNGGEWRNITTIEQAMELVPLFAKECVPHLVGSKVEVTLPWDA